MADGMTDMRENKIIRHHLDKGLPAALLAAVLISVLTLPAQGAQRVSALGAGILTEAGCYYGDPTACVMTRDQAAAFARVLREQYAGLSERYQSYYQ